MHIPSERVYKEIRSEEAGAWFVLANGGEDTAVLVKLPTSTAKSLLVGAKLELLIGTKNGYLCVGIRIYDVPEAPVLFCSVHRHLEEHIAIQRISRSGTSPIFLFNEMEVCVAWSNIELSSRNCKKFQRFLSEHAEFYSGEYSEEAIAVLDKFCEVTDSAIKLTDAALEILVLPLTYDDWTSARVSFAGQSESYTISINDGEEGEVLERAVWASLESVFPQTLTKAPKVQEGKKLREFTDVMATHEYGTFLIESKDLSILQAGINRSRDRRLKGIQKQGLKALSQLVGASKTARSGARVLNHEGNSVELVLNQPMHCIVLLTELMHDGDWSEVVSALLEASLETREFFHILDFRELINVLKFSNGDARLVDYNLMKRFECLVRSKSVHIRSRIGAAINPNEKINMY